MALADAILNLAGEMDKEAADLEKSTHESTPVLRAVLRNYATQLRLLVTASQEVPKPSPPAETPEETWNRLIRQREESREIKRKIEFGEACAREMKGNRLTRYIGGPADGDFIEVSHIEVPEGAKTFVDNAVYEYRNGDFYFVDEKTEGKLQ